MKNISFGRAYLYSLLSVFLWVLLFYLPYVATTPRGHHLCDYRIYPVICCGVLVAALVMLWAYVLLSLMNLSRLKRDIIFCLGVSYWYLPFSVLSMYQKGWSVLWDIKLYLLGGAILPAPLLFVYWLHRADRKTASE